MSYENRKNYIDLSKGIGITLVIIGHLNQDIFQSAKGLISVIYTFHMPLFFLLSGILFNKDVELKQFFNKKAKSLLVPYYIFTILFMSKTALPLLFNLLTGDKEVSKELIGLIISRFIIGEGLWFLPCLFTTSILFYSLCRTIKKDKYIVATSCLLAFIGFELVKSGIDRLPFQFSQSLIYLLYFSLGYYSCERIKDMTKCYRLKCIGLCGLWSAFNALNLILFGKIRSYDSALIFLLAPLFASLAIVLFARNIHNYNNLFGKIVLYLGRNSLIFYILHGFILNVTTNILYRIASNNLVWALGIEIIIAVSSILITMIIVYLINEIFIKRNQWILGRF